MKSITRLAGAWAKRRVRGLGGTDRLATLAVLLDKAKHTRFGRAFGFAEILAAPDLYSAFRERLPIIDYDQWVTWLGDRSPLTAAVPLVDEAWPGRVDIFCLSSGTTSGRTKFVPYSQEMAAINRRAAIDMFAHALAVVPDITPPRCKSLYMSGSTRLARNQHGALCGDMSALTKFLAPRLLERITLPSSAISDMEPWPKRLEALVQLCLNEPRIGSISGIPIWLLSLLEAIRLEAGQDLSQVLPNLRLLIHGGMSIGPYRAKLRELLGPAVMFQEVYAASETGISAFTVPGEPGMRFWEGYSVFYELESLDGEICLLDRAQPGVSYALIISSCSGLWRYRIGDRVVFTSPGVIEGVSRDKTTSAFDEKVTERELELAMATVTPTFADFSLGPDIPNRRHVWFLVTDKLPGHQWLTRLDDQLRQGNEDYDDYRGDGRINPPTAVVVKDRPTFLKNLGREEGGQRKFPRLLSPEETSHLLKIAPIQAS